MTQTRRFSGQVAAIVILASGLCFLPQATQAQEGRIINVQGSKAIVQFEEDYKPRVGETVITEGMAAAGVGGKTDTRSRAKLVGGSAELSSLSGEPGGTSTTSLSLSGRYGWNTGTTEYGPLATVVYRSSGDSSSTAFGAGGFFDYNLVPNRIGTKLVYGLGAEGSFTTSSAKIGNSSGDSTTFAGQGGGQLKWFGLANAVAVRVDGVYSYGKTSGAGSSTTISGLIFKGGLYFYF